MNSIEVSNLHSAIREKIVLCTAAQQLMFKRMYSPKKLDKPILDVVDDMPIDKLKCALSQIENTLNK